MPRQRGSWQALSGFRQQIDLKAMAKSDSSSLVRGGANPPYSRGMPQGDDAFAEVAAKLVAHGEEDTRTPTQRLLDRIAAADDVDTAWADEYAEMKKVDIGAQSDDAWE